ncbi:MAG: hypothetical protein F4X82_00390 [Candidatus Spechtbacteria bacterium SB0662_bin_43]|uniref:Primosomal protein N n=1 Tax=Candidatus Spechtbacteria bacterium SB0662_bin_43 TaxID=2604897 RepID=A0A845D9C7_9BACT|nr:hypothetical protein [Candidatus Spechtbacteria bacterium SB0662_bin_43]
MYLYSVIPLVSLPRSYPHSVTYFSGELLRAGCLVRVPLQNTTVCAIVIQRHSADEQKQAIRKSEYSLKKIHTVLSKQPVVSKNTLLLAVYLSHYYYESTGLTLRYILPASFSKPTRGFEKAIESYSSQRAPQPQPDTYHQSQIVMSQDYSTPQEHAIVLYPTLSHIPKNTSFPIQHFSHRTNEYTQWIPPIPPASFAGTKRLAFLPTTPTTPFVLHNENNALYVSHRKRPHIDVRVVARLRASVEKKPIIVQETVPSLEMYHFFKQNKFTITDTSHKMAPLTVVDARHASPMSYINEHIQKNICALKQDEQALIFTHRRGIASVLLCRQCGFIFKCSDCDTPYILHSTFLLCHRCSQQRTIPTYCVVCNSTHFKDLGAGTARIEKLIREAAPHLSVQRIDTDNTRTQKQRDAIFSQFANKEYNVLVGTTSLIHHHTLLPDVHLTATLNIDDMMSIPSYQASEQTFLTIWRMREKARGKSFLQTHLPHIPLVKHAQENSSLPFLEYQLAFRKKINAPPFSQETHLVYEHKEYATARSNATRLANILQQAVARLPHKEDVTIIGPAPGYHQKRKGYFRWYIIIQCKKIKTPPFIRAQERNKLLALVPKKWDIIIDPQNAS